MSGAKGIPSQQIAHVQAGDPLIFKHQDLNLMADAANEWATRQLDQLTEEPQDDPQAGIIWVKNSTGGDRDRFDVLGIDTPLFLPDDALGEFKNRVVLDCSTPSNREHVGRFVILLEPAADGKLARACIAGVCPARVIDPGSIDYGFADIARNDPSGLKAGQHGAAQILWLGTPTEPGEGDDPARFVPMSWAVVRLGAPSLVRRFELADDLPQGGSADAYPLDPTYTPDLDQTFPVWDQPMERFLGWRRRDAIGRNGARGVARFWPDTQRWEIFAMQNVAESIDFTLTEHMGVTIEGQASMTVDAFYRGVDPDVVFLDGINVFDPQSLFIWALDTAKGKATFDDISQKYKITECDQIARSIDFTITETGIVGADDVEVDVDDFYDGQDPELWFDETDTMVVHDPQALFPRALTGAVGKARFDDKNVGEYHVVECQQMATTIKCTAAADEPDTVTFFDIDPSVEVMLPITGQDPVTGDATYDPVEKGIQNTFGDAVAAGDIIISDWNEDQDQWEVVEIKRAGSAGGERGHDWAKAMTDWEDGLVPRVLCQACLSPAGFVPDPGVQFYVNLPRTVDQDPAIYAGGVIGYAFFPTTRGVPTYRTCVTPYMNGNVGDIRMVSRDDKVPRGWQECNGGEGTLRLQSDRGGHFLKSRDWVNDRDNIGDTGGFEGHGSTQNGHPDHELEATRIDDFTSGNKAEVYDATHTGPVPGFHKFPHPGKPPDGINQYRDTDNRPPYTVVMYIQRIK